ncbi:MAG: hypothetical protein K2F59_01820 [Eubacteriales bacterium]|nr:hypothetical protein [Eubacteriales bacterium]
MSGSCTLTIFVLFKKAPLPIATTVTSLCPTCIFSGITRSVAVSPALSPVIVPVVASNSNIVLFFAKLKLFAISLFSDFPSSFKIVFSVVVSTSSTILFSPSPSTILLSIVFSTSSVVLLSVVSSTSSIILLSVVSSSSTVS